MAHCTGHFLGQIQCLSFLIGGAPLAHEAAVPGQEVVCVELDPRLVGEDLQHAAALLVLDRGRRPDHVGAAAAVHAEVVVEAVVGGLLDCLSEVDPLSGKDESTAASARVPQFSSSGNVFMVPVTQVV